MQVKMTYQPYAENMAVIIDGRPIGMVSALSRYQAQPFAQWCDKILPALAVEVNERFDLTYVGRESEYRVLRRMMQKCPICSSIQLERPLIADTALVRLKKLSRLVMNGVECRRFSHPLVFVTDMDQEQLGEMIRAILPKLSFCRIPLSVQGIGDEGTLQSRENTLAVLGGRISEEIVQVLAGKTCGILWSGAQEAHCEDGAVVLPSGAQTLLQDLEEMLELVYYPQLLKCAISGVNLPDNSPFFSDVFVLDKVEPQVFVKLPKSIEYGETAEIKVRTFPRMSNPPEIVCRVSNETVLVYTPKGLTAVGTGEVVVEVYEAGKNIPFCTGQITAFRRNRIQKLSIQPNAIKMCVGETANIGFTYSPNDADNRSDVRLYSTNGTIAAIQNLSSIAARRPGICSIYYEAEKARSEECYVQVYPKLEAIEVSIDQQCVEENSLTGVCIDRFPREATLDKLSVRVEPADLGTYDMGSARFFARRAGTGRIVVSSDRCNVTASVPIEVRRKSTIAIKPVLTVAGIIAVVWLIWYVLNRWM